MATVHDMTNPALPNEYSVMDQHGVMFGMPAKTFIDAEAAARVLNQLDSARRRMREEAEAAERELAQGVASVRDGERLQEAVARWAREKDRVWTVFGRHVGPWSPIMTMSS